VSEAEEPGRDEEPSREERGRRGWRRLVPRTVRVRLTVVAALVFGIALTGAAFGLVGIVRNNLVDRIEETNQQQLDGLASLLRQSALADQLQPRSYVYQDPETGDFTITQRSPGPSRGFEEARRQINTAAGSVTLVAQRSLDEVDRTLDSVRRVLFFTVPALIALVAFLVWYFAGRALRPVEAIRVEAESITGTTMDRRVPEPDTEDEIGRLARTMNAMLARLEGSASRQRQFVSDASHELRSPLASIRANLEVALRHADRADWPAVAARTLAEDARMEDTVTELLELARLDESPNGAPLDSLPEVDVDELVLEDTMTARRVPVDTTRVSAGRVHGRSDQLARLIRNLVDNASRHAEHEVAVTLHGNDGIVELTVDDDGPGIPEDDRERVFERFTRLDEGRARDAGGLGIGLAIVQAVAEQHGGTVSIDDAPIGGARFVVRLPAA
jgi:signal transduction histidine kinase